MEICEGKGFSLEMGEVVFAWMDEGFCCIKEVGERYETGVWKAQKCIGGFQNTSGLEVGLVDWVKFWKGRWCRELSLRDSFLVLYSIASSRDDWC